MRSVDDDFVQFDSGMHAPHNILITERRDRWGETSECGKVKEKPATANRIRIQYHFSRISLALCHSVRCAQYAQTLLHCSALTASSCRRRLVWCFPRCRIPSRWTSPWRPPFRCHSMQALVYSETNDYLGCYPRLFRYRRPLLFRCRSRWNLCRWFRFCSIRCPAIRRTA